MKHDKIWETTMRVSLSNGATKIQTFLTTHARCMKFLG